MLSQPEIDHLSLDNAASSALRGAKEEGPARPLPLEQATERDKNEMELLEFSEHVLSFTQIAVFGVLLLLCLWTAQRLDQGEVFSFPSIQTIVDGI